MLSAIVRDPAPSARAEVPDLPEALEAVILRAMEKNPNDRFPSAGAMARALLPFASERIRTMYEDELRD